MLFRLLTTREKIIVKWDYWGHVTYQTGSYSHQATTMKQSSLSLQS